MNLYSIRSQERYKTSSYSQECDNHATRRAG